MPLVVDGRTLYTTAEVADRLGIAWATVRDAIRRGTLEKVEITDRLNMVPEAAVERYRREHLGRRGRPKGSKNRLKASPTGSPARCPGEAAD